MSDIIPTDQGQHLPMVDIPVRGRQLEGIKKDGYPLVSGEFNHQRWAHIMGIYASYMSDEAIARGVSSMAPPFVDIIREANNFPELVDIPENSPQERAFNMGVKDAVRQMEYLRGSQTLEQGIVTTIKLFEGFEKTDGTRPVDKQDGEYLHFSEMINDSGLFYILTGETSRNNGEINPNFEKFKEQIKTKPVDPNLFIAVGRLYQIGSRLSILQKITSR